MLHEKSIVAAGTDVLDRHEADAQKLLAIDSLELPSFLCVAIVLFLDGTCISLTSLAAVIDNGREPRLDRVSRPRDHIHR